MCKNSVSLVCLNTQKSFYNQIIIEKMPVYFIPKLPKLYVSKKNPLFKESHLEPLGLCARPCELWGEDNTLQPWLLPLTSTITGIVPQSAPIDYLYCIAIETIALGSSTGWFFYTDTPHPQVTAIFTPIGTMSADPGPLGSCPQENFPSLPSCLDGS